MVKKSKLMRLAFFALDARFKVNAVCLRVG